MQDNIGKTGSNWTGRTPRSTQEAGIGFFSQYPDSHYEEPTLADKIRDVFIVVGTITVCGYAVYFVGALLEV